MYSSAAAKRPNAQSMVSGECESDDSTNLTPRSRRSARNSADGYASSIHPREIAPVFTSTILPDSATASAVFASSSRYHAELSSKYGCFALNFRTRSRCPMMSQSYSRTISRSCA